MNKQLENAESSSKNNILFTSLRRQVFNSMVYGSADPCFALSDKKIKLHILSDPKNKISISEYFIPADRDNNYVK